MEGMDLHSQLLLDISQFSKQMNAAVRRHRKAMATMGTATGRVGKQAGAIAAKEQAHLKRTSKAIDKNTASWWKRFGAVALGFTIAYRAMNAFENGLTRVIMLIGDSIRVSGELASVQAKLAFWYQLHAKQVGNFNELYARAEVNVVALMRANLGAISTFEELATGIDEIAQSIGGIGPEWVEHLASVVDFTKLVAQTTGSTTRQIRQELQALMQGQIKTTDVMVRSLVRVGILTKKDIADLKKMTRQTEIFHHILTEIHSRWQEVAGIIIATNVEIAMQKWEDHLKFMLLIGAKIASEYEGVGNIFAQVFVDHMKKIRENMTHKDWTNTVLFMQNLAKALNFLLNVFEKILDVMIRVGASFTGFSETAAKWFRVLKYAAAVFVMKTAMSLLVKTLAKAAAGLRLFIGLIGLEALVGMKALDKSLKLFISRLIAFTVGLAAVGVAMTALWDIIASKDERAKVKKQQEDFVNEQMKGYDKLLKAGEITGMEYLVASREAWADAQKEFKVKGFFDYFKENVTKGLTSVGKVMEDGIKAIWKSITTKPDVDDEEMKKAIAKWKNAIDEGLKGLEGLGSIADPKVMFDEKAIARYQKSVASLADQHKAYSQTIMALKTGELWWKDSDAIRQYQDDIIATGKIAREYAELEEEVGSARADLWKGITEQVRAANLQYDNINRNLKMMEELQDSLFELTHTTHEVQMEMLRLEVENMRKTVGITEDLKKAIDEYYKYRMIQIERDFNHMNELAERTADSMEASFSDLFFDVITGDFEDLEDLVTRVLRNVQRILSDVLAQMLRAKLIGEQLGTGAYSGGVLTDWWKKLMGGGSAGPPVPAGSGYVPSYHTGGTAGITHPRIQVPDWFSSFAPRLHNGLKADEYPAILQAGERVIKRGGRDEDKVNIQINNYTGEKAEVKEDRNPYGGRDITVIIGETLSRDVSQGGALHQSLRRTFGLKPVTAGR